MAKKKEPTEGEVEVATEEITPEDTSAEKKPSSKKKTGKKAEDTSALTARITELETELAASKEAHMRTLAEYDNYRKRSVREKEGTYTDAKAMCISEILPILDNFERALAITDSDFESYKKGTEMIYTALCETLKKLGVEAFGEEGETFDPNFHNGVMHIEDEAFGENVIAQVFSKGYKIGDKVLRPAMVKVAN